MSRDEVTWLAIRGTGLFFAIKAIIAVPEAVSSLGAWFGLTRGFAAGLETDLSKVAGPMAIGAAAGRAFSSPAALAVYVVAAWYFLRGAPAIVRLINRKAE
jgi:hypothetical protein